MKIHGVDIGMRTVHVYSIGREVTPLTIMCHKSDRYLELRSIAHTLVGLFEDDDYVFFEEPPLAGRRNVRTLIGLSQTTGMIMAASRAHCYEVPVSKWKKEVVGNGNASKEEVAQWLRENKPEMYSECANQDQIDACCIALYGQIVVDRLSSAM